MKEIVIINSHPIQYFAPLYQKLAKKQDVNLEVVYCSKETLGRNKDVGFGETILWDIPLLSDYRHIFLRNYSLSPSIYKGFFGLFNPGIIFYLWRKPKSLIIVHGWAYLTHIIAIICAKIFGHKVCIRGDNTLKNELLKSTRLLTIKRFIFSKLLYPFIDYFLYVGTENKLFYQYYKVRNDKLIFAPHAVDNARFRASFHHLKERKAEIKSDLGIPSDHKVILFVGKFSKIKRPLDLLFAYDQLCYERKALVFVGSGELKEDMTKLIADRKLENVFFTGFINQQNIPNYYVIADIFVLCSESETWGLSVNEAMNFNLPLILADTVGCTDDLIVNAGRRDGNGMIFKKGDFKALADSIQQILSDADLQKNMGSLSGKRVELYTFDAIIDGIDKIVI